MDQATRLLKQASFDQATVNLLYRVLEDGWAQIRTSYTSARAEKIGRSNVADDTLLSPGDGTTHEDLAQCGLLHGGKRVRAGGIPAAAILGPPGLALLFLLGV
jgi:hypothetical protein